MKSGNKRLVLCFDGTWNAIADPLVITNVVKMANCVSVQDPKGSQPESATTIPGSAAAGPSIAY